MNNLEIGDYVSVINRFGDTEYIGIFLGFSRNKFDTLVHIDTKQGRHLYPLGPWHFTQKPIHMTFIFNETYTFISKIDNILLACE